MTNEIPSIINLNVGGRYFTTHLSTLTKEPDNTLASMFTGKQSIAQDQDGRYFIDADGSAFGDILAYLRYGDVASMMNVSPATYELAVQLGIKSFVEKVRNCKSVIAAEHRKKIRTWYPDYDEILNMVIEYINIKLWTANAERISIELRPREDPKEVPEETPFFIRPAMEDPHCFFLFMLLESDLMSRGFYSCQTQWRSNVQSQMRCAVFSFRVKDFLRPY